MKRPLFVFAGQSNMMGAAVYEASEQIHFRSSFEYLYKPCRFGEPMGEFKTYGFPTGEFAYKDLQRAYGEGASAETKSLLDAYGVNTYFCPSMCNLMDEAEKSIHSFSVFSEANNRPAVSLAPYIVKGLEEKGYCCAYTHIAKGGVPIRYYLEGEAEEYFYTKVSAFFEESEVRFADDDTSDRILVWLQGESDASNCYDAYYADLKELWTRAQNAGFNRFFLVRVGYFGSDGITKVMQAQEDFCRDAENAFIITRVCSFLKWPEPQKDWFVTDPGEEFDFCRDSFYGFANNHINEKGFRVIAKYAVPNIIRILFEHAEPVLEEELLIALTEKNC